VDAFATVREQLAQEPIAQLLLGEVAAVVALDELLGPPEVGREVLVFGDVQIAAQHPFLHLAHRCSSLDAAVRRPRTRR
jgi:hypothetical protein